MLVTASRGRSIWRADCPIEEEFDFGNVWWRRTSIGWSVAEPAGCPSVAVFVQFAKASALPSVISSAFAPVSFKLVASERHYIRRKGFRKNLRSGARRWWTLGAFSRQPLRHNRKITFSDFSYTEMVA